MQLQQPFDARTVEPASFAPPPPLADYHVRVADSEAKPTTKGDGGYVSFQLEILDPGPYAGRKIPYNLNLWNPNAQTCEIAYKQLSALCHVTQVFEIRDTRQLHNIPFIATIGPQKDQPTYSNVFGVKDINGNMPGKAAAAAPAVPPTAAPVATPPAAPAWGAPGASAPAAPPAVVQPPVWGGAQPVAQPTVAAPAPPWGGPAATTAAAPKPPWAT
jgi:uncharacterized protein DUF669